MNNAIANKYGNESTNFQHATQFLRMHAVPTAIPTYGIHHSAGTPTARKASATQAYATAHKKQAAG